MKILVAGAAGQVGCRLVRQLLQRNHEVRGTVLPDDPALARLHGLDIELAAGDLTDEAFVSGAVAGVDAVIHTANYVGPQFENNMQIDRLITRVCGAHADRLERLVYTSSSGVFPNNGETIACAYHPVDERHPQRPIGEYSLGKLLGEEFTRMAARETGLRTSIVRPSHVQSGDAILGRFTVGAVARLLQKGKGSPLGELHMADGTELWHDLLAEAVDEAQPCSVRDLDGRPWLYQPNDARDIAHMLVCALEEPGALDESFDRIQDELAVTGVCPIPMHMSAGEAEALAAARSFAGPHQRLQLAVVDGRPGIGIARGRPVRSIHRLLGRHGLQDRRDALHARSEADVEVPFVVELKGLDAVRDWMGLGQLGCLDRPMRVHRPPALEIATHPI